jgi:hypothetical protein
MVAGDLPDQERRPHGSAAAHTDEQRKISLEIGKLEQEVASSVGEREKLALEIQQLKDQLSPIGKLLSYFWPIFSSALTLTVSFGAIYISLSTTTRQLAFQEKERHDEGLRKAVELATDGSGFADRRIAGIWQLNGLWKDGHDDEILASVLSAELTLGDDRRFARCAAAEVIGNAITAADLAEDPVHAEHDARRRVHLLYGSRSGDIGIVVQQHLMLRQIIGDQRDQNGCFRKVDPLASTSCTTALDATREAIRKNWEYLRDANLNCTDLSKIQLYEADLSKASLRGAALPHSNFRCSNLFQADMTGADWTMADFRFANVTGAIPAEFVRFATAHGAFEHMDDDTWLRWRRAGFLVKGGGYLLKEGSGSRCGEGEVP